ncbi:MAG TPA: phosphatase PAP2 family protein [Candidatus Angelobacter sp.]
MNDVNAQLPTVEREEKPLAFLGVAVPLSLLLSIAGLFLFAWIAEEVIEDHTRRFDSAIRGWVHQYSSPTMTEVAKTASWLGEYGVAIALVVALVLFLAFRWRRAALWLTITQAGALVLNVSLKYAFHRTRPDPFFGSLPHSYSFPSGHALFSFCFYGVLAGLLVDRIRSGIARTLIWIAASALIAAIGLSRIYLGVHYPTDVVGGYLTAAIWVSSMIAFDRLRVRRRQSRVSG